MSTVKYYHFWKRLLLFFLPLWLVFSLLGGVYLQRDEVNSLRIIKIREKNTVSLYSRHIGDELLTVFSDLKFFSMQNHLRKFVDGDLSMRNELESDYLVFIGEKKLYDQMRFLDQSGMERFRVNYNAGSPEIVPDSKLQNKFARYYFSDAFALGPGEIFISPLDLNVENRKIEQPIKPMIRVALPIFSSKAEKKGVLLFNYFGERMLDMLDEIEAQSLGRVMLVNRDGYWLKGIHPEDEWGFMYPDKMDTKFQARYPTAWNEIVNADNGQFLTESGLFTFSTIRPLEVNFSDESLVPTPGHPSLSIPEDVNYYWKIISYVSPETISKQSQSRRKGYFIAYFIITGLFGTLSVIKVRSRISKEKAEAEIVSKNKALEAKQNNLESALKEIVEKNSDLENAYIELKKAQTQLLHAEKMQSIGRLAAGIAHEINTPIQFISDNTHFVQDAMGDIERLMEARDRVFQVCVGKEGTIEIAKEADCIAEEIDIEFLRTEIPSAIEHAIEGTERVAKIVRAMKSFSHPELEEKALADINEAIKNTTIVSRSEWRSCAQLEFEWAPDLPPVYCVIGDINQVVLNMISNAAFAIKEALETDPDLKGVIRITTQYDKDNVLIIISDNGTGIPEEHTGKIFDHFFTTKDIGVGTGQGLAISYSIIVEKHGGSIDVKSKPGHGTTFIISLPIDNSEDDL